MPSFQTLKLPQNIASNYKSPSQKVRIMTEYWVANVMFCPNCGGRLEQFGNNSPVADFYCKPCIEEFELKSKNGSLGKKIVDGAYTTMIERLSANNNPNFLFLTYDKANLSVINFLVIPKYFFTEDIIEKRKPLAPTARRAGWVGCNIAMGNIPAYGKIFLRQERSDSI
jgi:type II restriction enzyme